jgi:hypothetical protein
MMDEDKEAISEHPEEETAERPPQPKRSRRRRHRPTDGPTIAEQMAAGTFVI